MATRKATPWEERAITAYHEAGHLTATLFCEYFGLRDPAVQLDLKGSFAALSGAKKIKSTADPVAAKESVREFVMIAFSGKAAEETLEALTAARGQRVIPNPGGAQHDLLTIQNTLGEQAMEHEYDALWTRSQELIAENWAIVEQIAELIILAPSSEISRASILALPAVRDRARPRGENGV